MSISVICVLILVAVGLKVRRAIRGSGDLRVKQGQSGQLMPSLCERTGTPAGNRHGASSSPSPSVRHRSTPPAIALDGVHKSFGSVEAMRAVDLTITSGEVVAFLGQNGTGNASTCGQLDHCRR
jgi:ABC-type glutathione transport system ATPase component